MLMVNQLAGFGSGGGTLVTTTALSQAGNADDGGWTTYTLRSRIAAALLTGITGIPQRIRVTLYAASAETITIDASYIGHQGGSDAFDAVSLTQILWSGSGGVTVTGGNSTTSDWVNFAWDKASDLIITAHVNGSAAADGFRAQTSLTGATRYDKTAVSEAGTADVTGYSSAADRATGFLKIEIEELV